MKSMFDVHTMDETLGRIARLDGNSKALWGKMNVYQMVKHCVLAEQHYHGEYQVVAPAGVDLSKGPKVLAMLLGDAQPMIRNARTAPEFEVKEANGDLAAEIAKWKALISSYVSFRPDTYGHWYFGQMSREQLGQLSYKHNDHHLRQFGV